MSIARGDQHVVAVALVAPEQVRPIVAVAVFDRRVRAVDRQALEAAPRDEVDDAGNGVRAIRGRGAVLQHFDSLDRAERQQIRIDAQQRNRRYRQAPAVEQHERPAAVEAAQVDADSACSKQHTAGVPLADRSLRCRQRTNDIEYRERPLTLELFAVEYRDRQCGVFHCASDIGARHDDLFDRFGVARCVVGSCRGRHCREQSSCDG